ncbi:uncharacterized protein [Euwallacea similis]|uniref:uncharacterized protein n=1 Tax=Euwallacea similis TaxID=1736056 RepID=UPI00344FEF69
MKQIYQHTHFTRKKETCSKGKCSNMILRKFLATYAIALVVAPYVQSNQQNVGQLSRRKRYVSFPEGAAFSAVICLTWQMGITDGASIFSEGINWGLVYDLPNDTRPLLDAYKPAQKRRNRRELYNKIEDILDSMGYNGRSCMLRSLCETERMFKNREDSLIHHILGQLFRFPKERILSHEPDVHKVYHWAASIGNGFIIQEEINDKANCGNIFQCPFSLIEMALGYYSAISNNKISY